VSIGSPEARGASVPGPSPSTLDTRDTSGHTRLKVFGGLYGAYLGIAIPIALQADDATPYAMGLMLGPSLGLMSASGYAGTHSCSSGDAIAVSALTWFGAMQGHLWEAAAEVDDDGASAAFGVLGSLGGLVAGLSATGARDFSEGHAAALGAGHWWGTALGYFGARADEQASDADKALGAAIGGATGLTFGALAGRGRTLNDIRYLHIGGALGWLYSAGIVVLQDPGQKGESLTQMAGIGAGMTAGFLAARYRPWRSRAGMELDHSGRIRAQVFSMLYGGYLATVIPLASEVEWWTEDTKKTYTLAYMHAPPAFLLGTTFFTRNTRVSNADAMTVSGLTWFGATQGALWASAVEDKKTRDVATASVVGSAAGLAAGVVLSRGDLTEAQGAMLGAGNWWGSALGLLFGSAILGEDADSEQVSAAVALGSIAGVAAGSQVGRQMSMRKVRTMHIGGFAGWLFGTGILLGGDSAGFSTAMSVMGVTTFTGLALGAAADDGLAPSPTSYEFNAKPFVARRPGLSGEKHTVVGFTLGF
jgi:hypothetical protein